MAVLLSDEPDLFEENQIVSRCQSSAISTDVGCDEFDFLTLSVLPMKLPVDLGCNGLRNLNNKKQLQMVEKLLQGEAGREILRHRPQFGRLSFFKNAA
jgi:hypothetical protein